ncbi:MAG: P-type conjugative transfer protein TrbL [Pseudomonadota bacterium]|nr:P-type conjugative transfer protein TrbL [Pseudomonadota bacterium]
MHDLGVIDQFLQTFIRYIDSGFGLLSGNVAALSSILIALDVTIAGLFWALEGEANVLGRLIKKVLYVSAFAFIIDNFSSLATIIYKSFAGLGLQATGSALTPADLLRPGKLAGTGFQAAWPLLQEAGNYIGFTTLMDHAVTILVLVVAWLIVVLSFFILAVQLFITILEFKLTTLAGFVLVPFALWNKTAFLAERVLGNVVASGVKVMVLAVIVGIGTTFFHQFVQALPGQQPSLKDAMTLVLASLALFGLGIFGPGIATGLVAGAPQLGAGAAIGTGAALVGGTMLAAGGTRALGGAGLGAIRAGTALGAGAGAAYRLGQMSSGQTGMAGVAAGLSGVARAGTGTVMQRAGGGFADSARAGRQAAWRATGGTSASTTDGNSAGGDGAPAWARRLHRAQRLRGHAQMTTQAIREGDRPGAGMAPSIRKEGE